MREWLFFTGTPGSRWSSVSQQIALLPNTNRSDETPQRDFKHSQFSGHKGMYFGPGKELGKKFHELSSLSASEIAAEVNRAYPESLPGQRRIIKCHMFSYQLDEIHKRFPTSQMMLVYRPDDVCYDWWTQIGGFSIKYPRYDWYEDLPTMKKRIAEENRCIQTFAERQELRLELFTPEWVEKNFGTRVEFDTTYFNDVYTAVTP